MNIDKTLVISSTSFENTESIGEAIGRCLRGGEVIELISDVGGGKTTLVRGLVRGAGSDAAVSSPTFTINRRYPAPQFAINHLDLYRLGTDPGTIEQEIREVIQDGSDVVAVEWADSLRDILPVDRLKVDIVYEAEDSRRITISVPKTLSYLVEEIGK